MSNQITKYLKPIEVSQTYNVPLNTLRKWRCEKRGLPYIVIGRMPGHKRSGNIFYDRAVVEEFFNKGLVNVR
jgi:hypothetical protein